MAKRTGYPKRRKGYYKIKLPNFKHRQALNIQKQEHAQHVMDDVIQYYRTHTKPYSEVQDSEAFSLRMTDPLTNFIRGETSSK